MAIEVTPRAQTHMDRLERVWQERPGLLGWITTTDHKRIGLLYFFTSLAFFAAGGVEALLLRTQLIGPSQHVLSPEAYDELFTMHGITMIFLFVIPMTTGAFGNYLVPLMIGARDMAFPRMNAVSYWLYLASGLFLYAGLFGGHAPNAGWFDYVPLASKAYDPGINIDFYGYGLIFNGISSTAASILRPRNRLRRSRAMEAPPRLRRARRRARKLADMRRLSHAATTAAVRFGPP